MSADHTIVYRQNPPVSGAPSIQLIWLYNVTYKINGLRADLHGEGRGYLLCISMRAISYWLECYWLLVGELLAIGWRAVSYWLEGY